MKGKMKNRLALLSILLVTGLLLGGIGTALGAGSLLKFGKEVSASVTTNKDGMQIVTIREDGKVIKEVTLPKGSEGQALSMVTTPDGKMVITQVSKGEIEKSCNEPGFHCETGSGPTPKCYGPEGPIDCPK